MRPFNECCYTEQVTRPPPQQAGPGDQETIEGAIEKLVNQVAHDVRNYAFAAGLQAELGARRAADPIAAKEHFDAVLRQVDKLKVYLDKLLLYGRPFRPVAGPLEPMDLLQEVALQVQSAWPPDQPRPVIHLEAGPSVGPVRWDRRGIHAALSAVVDNAVRSAPHPPPVHVSVEAEGENVFITVRDEGQGIPAETLARLDLPMACRRSGGAGLGLAIARKMIKAHGGTLTITTGDGGTSVRLLLPREVPAE